jgi:hypothetical protein
MPRHTNGPAGTPETAGRTGRRLELWVRAGDADEVAHLVARARRLESAGRVASVAVREWPGFLDLPVQGGRPGERDAAAAARTFARWAWRHGTDLPGFGERRLAGRGRMGPTYVARRTPRAVLAEYVDGALVNVTPCDEGARCLAERLAALERGADAERPGLPQ